MIPFITIIWSIWRNTERIQVTLRTPNPMIQMNLNNISVGIIYRSECQALISRAPFFS